MTVSTETPRQLPAGLTLRWATPEDVDKLAEFNSSIHEEDDSMRNIIGQWVRDLCSGDHPTTSAADFTLVENAAGEIVSSLCIIPQTWAYAGLPMPVGRPELVGTHPDYRQRRLVRLQMELIHAKGAARGELLQGITGIPWYYRRFGYDMALDLGGARRFVWGNAGGYNQLKPAEEEPYRWRQAAEADIPLLQQLYAIHNAPYLLTTLRSDAEWEWVLNGPTPPSVQMRTYWIIENQAGESVGYVQFALWPDSLVVYELAVLPGRSLRDMSLYLLRAFKRFVDEKNETSPFDKSPVHKLSFAFGRFHPVYTALDPELEKQLIPYAWYIRIPDLPAFLRHVQPLLEARLAESVMAGHTGEVKLNFYTSTLTLAFEKGRMGELGTYQPKQLQDGDAVFPDLTFLKLVCGRHSLEEIKELYPDCYAKAEAKVLLGILFPKQPSQPVALG